MTGLVGFASGYAAMTIDANCTADARVLIFPTGRFIRTTQKSRKSTCGRKRSAMAFGFISVCSGRSRIRCGRSAGDQREDVQPSQRCKDGLQPSQRCADRLQEGQESSRPAGGGLSEQQHHPSAICYRRLVSELAADDAIFTWTWERRSFGLRALSFRHEVGPAVRVDGADPRAVADLRKLHCLRKRAIDRHHDANRWPFLQASSDLGHTSPVTY